jgi:hypothetical protein
MRRAIEFERLLSPHKFRRLTMSDRSKKAGSAERRSRERFLELIGKGDLEQAEKELSKISDPALGIEFRNKVRRAAGRQKIERLLADGADEDEIEEQLSALPPPCPEEREWISRMLKEELDRQACLQALRSTGKGSPKINPAFGTIALYYQLEPSDGIEAALAQATPAILNMTMDCLERASNAQALPVRDRELNYATKGALILPALTKALDAHRLMTEKITTEKLRRSRGGKSPKKPWE